ncbi:hypothetical protein POM88_053542 [Heracleum sosnowskyi]|uniref:Uncharacterized protein n=1 Tax=Heracleum sosnowskyi TaxID=360622 RepID=A0AAD8LXQ4_9APIA|nr:hypothetical protein POM88_053542 [Heracleum sosnowskyi]
MIAVKILKLETELDLAMLQIKATNCEYAINALEVCTGQGVDIIVSYDDDYFSYTCGIVAFERRPHEGICHPKKIKFIDEQTIFVQVHGLHGLLGHKGAPIFDSRCRIIWIYSYGFIIMNFLIH